jgi:Domain of unknown function (DUF4388)
VTFAARLEDLELPSILRMLATNRKTGKLVLTRRDGQALLVFREGRIIYAASSSIRETFGSILLCKGLISEQDLTQALEQQHWFREQRRLGSILIEMGKVDQETLDEVMKQQTEAVIAELFRWKTGFFKFEPMEIASGGEVEVDVKDFLVLEGFDTEEVLLEAATALDQAAAEPSRAPEAGASGERAAEVDVTAPFTPPLEWGRESSASGAVPLSSIVGESRAPAFTAEIALMLMRYAAQLVSRGVLFLVRSDEARGMGQFGVQIGGRSAADRVRNLAIPLAEPSLFREVVERRETFRGRLAATPWNQRLVEQLGGREPPEVVGVPMIVSGAVSVIFYGDNLPEDRAIGPMDGLEFMMAEAALAMERAAFESREQTLERKRGGP